MALMQVRHQYILENFAQQLANKDNRLELKPVPDKPTRKRTQVREGLVL